MSDYPQPLVAVDVAAFTVLDADLKLLLIRRGLPPHALALPGGFVRATGSSSPSSSSQWSTAHPNGEDLDEAARRELLEETRLPASSTLPLVQVHVFGAPDRDPRARVIAVAYLAVVRPELAAFVRAGSDAAGVMWWSVADLDKVTLAFDHAQIADRCLAHLRRAVDDEAADLLRALVPQTFTMAELRAAYDTVQGRRADPGNFRRRFLHLVDEGVVVAATGKRVTARRPARVFAFAVTTGLSEPGART